MTHQNGRITDFFGDPQPQIRHLPMIQQVEVNLNEGVPNNGGIANNPIQQPAVQQPIVQQPMVQQPEQQVQLGGVEGNVGRNDANVILVQRNQDPD